jgi:hypothetical protein
MSWRRAGSSIGVVVVGIAMALAPVIASPAGAASKLKPGSCTSLGTKQAQSSRLATSLGQAFASGNFAVIKADELSAFSKLGSTLTAEKSLLGSAPANVKAALATIGKAFSQLKTQIAASTNLAQLEAAFTSLGTNPKLTSASKVLANYYRSSCG